MDWSKPWSEEKSNRKTKWNYVFVESLKMALLLPLIILFIEIFILNTWPDLRERPMDLVHDYLFMFSIVFLIFVVFHLVRWQKRDKHSAE